MNAAFLDFGAINSNDIDISPLKELTEKLTIYDHTSQQEIKKRIKDCELIYINKVNINKEIITEAKKLKFIGVTATGVNNVNINSALKHNIAVCNIRAYCTNSVIEHVFAVILQLTHNIQKYQELVAQDAWQNTNNFCLLDYPIKEISSLTLGIIGHGELGKGVEKVAKAFGMKVLITSNPNKTKLNKSYLTLTEVLKNSDIISIHCPLNENTNELIGYDEIKLMKSSAILINTARGHIVDSFALTEALIKNKIAGAAIDVLKEEPPRYGDPLLKYKGMNLILTPHIAWASLKARQKAINELALNIKAYLKGTRRNRIV